MNCESYPDIHPSCCSKMEEHPAIFLRCPNSIYTGNIEEKPNWFILCYDKNKLTGKVLVHCCPFCGKQVPNVVKSDIKKKIFTCSDGDACGGDYCDTCGKRIRECSCLPPEYRWKLA